MLVAMAMDILNCIFWCLRSVYKIFMAENIFLTSIYVRNNGLCLWYKGSFITNSKFQIFTLLPW